MDFKNEIRDLKKQRNAVIVAHNYQRPEVQDISDFTGSSLELAKKVKNLNYDAIIFCGVDFMANTAKVLNEDKTVVMPDYHAGCPLARMLKPEDIFEARKKYPKAPILLYTNTDIGCQVLADAIYTAGNVLNMVENMARKWNSNEIIVGPDTNMAYYISKRSDKKIIPVPQRSFCGPHARIMPEFIEEIKKEHPKAKVMAHMECSPSVQKIADYIGSTGDMVKWVKNESHEEWIVGTVETFIYRLKNEAPQKSFYPARFDSKEITRCPNMDLISIEKIRDALFYFDEIPAYDPTKPKYEESHRFSARKIEIPKEFLENARKVIESSDW